MCITRLDIILYFLLVEQFQKHLFHIIEVDEVVFVLVLTILFLPTAGKAENKSCIFTLVGGYFRRKHNHFICPLFKQCSLIGVNFSIDYYIQPSF